eukprot:Hpha_TRINITY_DN15580_c0_g2::TRINITY_DN15580_c0_g2_i2::g.105949::m.105949
MDASAPTGWVDTVDGEYFRDDCKTVDGRATYWKQTDDYYVYYCAAHQSWGISAQHYTSWTEQGNGNCMVKVDGGDDTASPVMVTEWWAWADGQWHRLEADWSTVVTCPLTDHIPPTCSPTGSPSTKSPLAAGETHPPVSNVVTPSPTASTKTPTVLGQCPPPANLAHVAYSAGDVEGQLIGQGSSAWLSGEKTTLLWPEGGGGWLNCGSWYKLGMNRKIPAGSSIDITCHADVCDAYVFNYHRPPYSGKANGGLTASLPDDGWVPGSCAPQFTIQGNPPGCKHPMVAHRKQLVRDATASVQIDDEMDAMYVVIAVVAGSDCSLNTRDASQPACENVLEGAVATTCKWDADAGSCDEGWCHHPLTAPNGDAGHGITCPIPDLSDPEGMPGAPTPPDHFDEAQVV